MNVIEFEQQLHKFLTMENHPFRTKDMYDVDMDHVIGLLNYLGKVKLNNCYEFDYFDNSFIIYLDCYECGQADCNKNKLREVLVEFKKLYRRGFH